MEIPPEIRYVVQGAKSIAYQRWGSGDQRIVAIAPALGNLDLVWSDTAVSDAFISAARRSDMVMS